MKNICIIIYKKKFNKIYISTVLISYFFKNYYAVIPYRYPYPTTYAYFLVGHLLFFIATPISLPLFHVSLVISSKSKLS